MQEQYASLRRAARKMKLQPLCRPFQFTRCWIEANQSLCPSLAQQTMKQFAFATAQISDGLSTGRPKRLDDSRHPFIVQADRSLKRIFRRTACLRFDGLLLRLWRQPLERGASQNAAVTKIAADDQFLRRVLIEPALAAFEQLVDFILP